MRGKDTDKIILDILKNDPKTRKELLDEAVNQGIPKSSVYRHIRKLIGLGEIREGKLQVIEQIEEANRQDVDSILDQLIEEENENVIYSKLKQLTKWAYRKRLAHFPNVIQKLSKLLDKQNIILDEKNLNQIFGLLAQILFYEQTNKGLKWKKIMKQLVDTTLYKAEQLLDKKPNNYIIEYLGRTNTEHAVELIFKVMIKHKTEVHINEFSSIVNALNKDRLSREHKKLVDKKLDEFLKSGDERLIKLALEIRDQIT